MQPVTRTIVTAVAVGALAGAAGLASALVPPVGALLGEPTEAAGETSGQLADAPDPELPEQASDRARDRRGGDDRPGDGEPTLLVGASRVSIAPTPDADAGEVWEQDLTSCAVLTPEGAEAAFGAPVETLDHVVTADSPWPENPDCIYMGGFGLGPMNPAVAFDDELGLWVRAVALSDGQDTAVLAVVDGEGWWWEYASKCDECGAKQIAERVGAELGIDPEGIVISATHSHASPDFIGGWGFVPDWYLRQVTAAFEQAITEAVTGAVPAVVEVGEERAREFNSERRDTYRSAEEQTLTWLRAVAPGDDGVAGPDDEVVATLGAYAAHPTRFGTNDGVAHPDWPGLFVHALEERFGGVGLQIMGGLGNMSGAGDRDTMGEGLAALLPEVGDGGRLDGTDVRFDRVTWRQPATNVPLTALAVPGFFDRRFDPVPAQVAVGKSESSPCVSAAPYSVELAASAFWLGSDVAITTGPGELFSNATNTVKEESGARIAMPLAQANDALGYMPQSFEFRRRNQQGAGFGLGGVAGVNYEDSYAIDACTGDMWLETILTTLAELR